MADVSFGIADYCFMSAILAVTCAPGLVQVFRAGKVKTVREFAAQSRDVGVLPLAMSVAATTISSAIFLGIPSDAAQQGIVLVMYSVGLVCVIPVGVYLYLPVFSKIKSASVLEYVEHRFNRKARRFLSVISCLRTVFSASLVIYSASVALNQVSGLNLWTCVALISAVCIFYSSLGGFKAVIFTDVMQLLVMIAVTLLVVIKGYINQGGWASVWEANARGSHTQLLILESFSGNGTAVLPIFVGVLFVRLSAFTKQNIHQRCNASTKNFASAGRVAMVGQLIAAGIILLLTLTGLAMYARYGDCDPAVTGEVKNRNQLTLLYAAETLSFADGLTGVYFAGLLCVAISTLSTIINSSTTLMMEDLVKPLLPKLTESQFVTVAKVFGIVFGCVAVGLVYVVQQFRGLVSTYFVINGMFSGPTLGLFTLGMLSPWTSTFSAILGCTVSTLFIGWVSVGRMLIKPSPLPVPGCNTTSGFASSMLTGNGSNLNLTHQLDGHLEYYFPLSSLNPYWYICWSTLISIILGLLATLCFSRQNPDDVSPDLIFPFVVKLIRGLPSKWRRRLGFVDECSKYTKGLSISWPLTNQRGQVLVVETVSKECIPLAK